MAIEYGNTQEALKNLLAAVDYTSTGKRVTVYEDAIPAEMTLNNMPFINIVLDEADVDLVSMPRGYYESISYKVTVYAFHLSSYREATNLRDQVLALARLALMDAGQFHSSIETSKLGPKIQFGTATPESLGGHVALATLTVIALGYNS